MTPSYTFWLPGSPQLLLCSFTSASLFVSTTGAGFLFARRASFTGTSAAACFFSSTSFVAFCNCFGSNVYKSIGSRIILYTYEVYSASLRSFFAYVANGTVFSFTLLDGWVGSSSFGSAGHFGSAAGFTGTGALARAGVCSGDPVRIGVAWLLNRNALPSALPSRPRANGWVDVSGSSNRRRGAYR